MKDRISSLLKRYVDIFLQEYASYLDKEQKEILNNINYSQVIKLSDFSIPVGIINYESIYISDNLINIPKKQMTNTWLDNKNYTNYLNYLNNVGCDTYEYYVHQLMFLVFKLVIREDNGIINGFINSEVDRLRKKYKFQAVNLYKREEVISNKVRDILGNNTVLKIMFMDMPTAFKYLNDNLGYRYADFYYQITTLVQYEYQKIKLDRYTNSNGLVNYAHDYDKLLYGNAYDYLLDFNINNNIL